MPTELNSLIDHPLVNQFLFFPSPLSEGDFPKLEHGSIHRIGSGSDTISAYWYRPIEDAPTVLMFHGNGEVVTDYLYDYHKQIEALGLNFAVVDYKGYGLSSGSPCLSGILEDGHAAWNYFTEELGVEARQIIILGRSMGSIPALELASSAGLDCRGVIIESGIAGFHRWIDRMGSMIQGMGLDFEGLKRAFREELNHQQKVEKISRPLLILHTENDQIVPARNAGDLYDWADPKYTTLKVFPQGDHNSIFLINQNEYFQVMGEFTGRL